MIHESITWAELAEAISKMSPEEKEETVKIEGDIIPIQGVFLKVADTDIEEVVYENGVKQNLTLVDKGRTYLSPVIDFE